MPARIFYWSTCGVAFVGVVTELVSHSRFAALSTASLRCTRCTRCTRCASDRASRQVFRSGMRSRTDLFLCHHEKARVIVHFVRKSDIISACASLALYNNNNGGSANLSLAQALADCTTSWTNNIYWRIGYFIVTILVSVSSLSFSASASTPIPCPFPYDHPWWSAMN